MTDLSDIVTSAFWRVNPPDTDPVETREWLEAFDALVAAEGRERATFLLRKLLDHARARRVPLPPVLNTPYMNSIALAHQPHSAREIQRAGGHQGAVLAQTVTGHVEGLHSGVHGLPALAQGSQGGHAGGKDGCSRAKRITRRRILAEPPKRFARILSWFPRSSRA